MEELDRLRLHVIAEEEQQQRRQRAAPCYAAAAAGDERAAIEACEAAFSSTASTAAEAAESCPVFMRELLLRPAQDDPWCAVQRRGKRRLQQRERYEATGSRLLRAGVPERSRKLILAAQDPDEPAPLEPTPALGLVQAFMSRKPALVPVDGGANVTFVGGAWCLVLAGNIGIGKTVAAASALADSPGGLFVSAPQFEAVEYPIGPAIGAGLLVLDDAGCERAGAANWATDRITRILCDRYAANRLTIVTANLSRKAFVARYGERVGDRLNEGGVYVGLAGRSCRGDRTGGTP